MENSYWQSANFLHDLIAQIPAGIFWKDKNSVFLGCNEFFAKLAALNDPRDVVGKTDFDLPWGQYQAPNYLQDDKEVILSKQPKLGIEEKQTLADGTECFLLTNKIPLFSQSGEVVGILGIFHDITRRKQMEESLKKAKINAEMANEAKGEFIANMSHDIRTPLTGVIGLSHILYEQLKDNTNKQFAKWIFESGQQLLSLLNSILDIVSIETIESKELFLETFDFYELVQETVQLHRPASIMKGLDFETILDEKIPVKVKADRAKIYRILLNLLSNAIKFTATGFVRLETKLLQQKSNLLHIEFRVSDSGIGISKEIQTKVFERFFRAHPSYHGTYKGHGLGLHIAKNYVDLMGGEMGMTSSPGRGTQFYFRVNMEMIEMERTPKKFTDSKEFQKITEMEFMPLNKVAQPKAKIMLVEDNHIAIKMVEIFCHKLNYELDCFQTVESAFQSFQKNNYDLIISDIGLPILSGFDLVQKFRDHEQQISINQTPIIGLTAHANLDVKQKGLSLGMQDVINKPISIEVLEGMFNTFCQKQDIKNASKKDNFTENLFFTAPYYEKFYLFHLEKALMKIHSKAILREMIMMFLEQDLISAQQSSIYALEQENYGLLQEIVHKIRGGAIYCSTERLLKISEILEEALLQCDLLKIKSLFFLWINILHLTIVQLKRWLEE